MTFLSKEYLKIKNSHKLFDAFTLCSSMFKFRFRNTQHAILKCKSKNLNTFKSLAGNFQR